MRGGFGVGGGPPAGPRRVSPLGVPGVANDANVIVQWMVFYRFYGMCVKCGSMSNK